MAITITNQKDWNCEDIECDERKDEKQIVQDTVASASPIVARNFPSRNQLIQIAQRAKKIENWLGRSN
jgi:hypothetical protein